MRQVTIKNRKDSAVLSDRFFPFFILTIFIFLCKHTDFIVFPGGSKNLGQIFLFYLSRKFLCKKYFIIHNEKRHSFECLFLYQQLPILPGRFRPSTFGVCELNFRVRYGYGWILTAVATESLRVSVLSKPYRRSPEGSLLPSATRFGVLLKLRPRPISTASLQTLRLFHSQPIYLIVCKGSYSLLMRSLISGRASRLDAFSVYPFRMRLSGRATGVTTGTPLIRPLRSSRTRSSFPQTSCARDGYEPNCLTTF